MPSEARVTNCTAQAWQLTVSEMNEVDSVWNNFLRRMVKGGFERGNVPEYNEELIPAEQIDWTYKISNKRLLEITKTTELKHFCAIQHLKYVAHIVQSGNNTIQKQMLFCEPNGNRWRRMASYVGVDETQLRRAMMCTIQFNRLVKHLVK